MRAGELRASRRWAQFVLEKYGYEVASQVLEPGELERALGTDRGRP